MLVNLKISDELYEVFVRRDAKNPRAAMERTLAKYAGVDPDEAQILVKGEDFRKLGEVLDNPVSTVADLIDRVVKSQRVKIGNVELRLDEGQRLRLKSMADFMKEDPDEFLRKQLAAALAKVV